MIQTQVSSRLMQDIQVYCKMPYIAPVVTMCICSKIQQICPSFIHLFKILNQSSFILNISQQQKFSIFQCQKITVVSILCIVCTTTVREKMQQQSSQSLSWFQRHYQEMNSSFTTSFYHFVIRLEASHTWSLL